MQVFSKYGKILDIDLVPEVGAGLVTFEDIISAFWAKIHLHNKKLTRDKAFLEITFIPSKDLFLQQVQIQKGGSDESRQKEAKSSESPVASSQNSIPPQNTKKPEDKVEFG